MKKVLAVAIVTMCLGTTEVFAQDVNTTKADTTTVNNSQAPADEFVKMDAHDLPQDVQLALGKEYSGYTIKEAYIATKEEEKLYKVVLVSKEGKDTTVILTEKGEIKK